MTVSALVRLAPVFDTYAALDPERPPRDMYQAGSFKPLIGDTVPLLVNHDDERVIGRALEFYEAECWQGGRWHWARCEITDPPGWLRRDRTGVSFGYHTLRVQDMGGWRRVLRMAVTEVSLLSPAVEPAEPRARVVYLAPSETSSARTSPGDVIYHRGQAPIRRYFETEITVR